MQIVRIEHKKDGFGIFRSAINLNDLPGEICDKIYERHTRFPTPHKDKKLKYIKYDEFCAFKTVNQFKRWFTKKEIKGFAGIGFRVYLIDVKDCRIGSNQVVFEKKDIINKTDITELFI